MYNTGNWQWDYLTKAFCINWERGVPNWESRLGAYNYIMPINWGNTGGNSGNGDNTSDPVQNGKRYPKLSECLSLFDHSKKQNNNGDDNEPVGPGGVTAGFNAQPCLDYYNKYHGSLYYSMPNRTGVFSGVSADCSSFVTYMLELGYGLQTRELRTTETLHDFLTNLGYKCIEEKASATTTTEYKTGDVIIMGRRGFSSGANGHTAICLASPKIYDCTPNGAQRNGLNVYDSAQAFLSWHFYGNSNPYFYHYTK